MKEINTDLTLLQYIDYIIENDVLKSEMYDFVLKKGQSNIQRLKYMLQDVNDILYRRQTNFVYGIQKKYIENIIEQYGVIVPMSDYPGIEWTLDEEIECVKKHPFFNKCNEKQKNRMIAFTRRYHNDYVVCDVNGRVAIAGYDLEYHPVIILKECLQVELERLKDTKHDIPELQQQKIIENAVDTPLNMINKLNTKIDSEESTTNNTANHQQFTLPDNLLRELQEQGFIENAAVTPLKWLKTKSLLAYFVDVANDKLKLKHGDRRQIKPFETLFDVSGLQCCINNYKKTGDLPVDYEIVDKLKFWNTNT
jgi:hypothetical protein